MFFFVFMRVSVEVHSLALENFLHLGPVLLISGVYVGAEFGEFDSIGIGCR
jgi:hypothetical protein